LAGVAIADVWREQVGSSDEILFVGAQGGLEEKLVPKAGYRLQLLQLGALNRASRKQKIKTLLQLPLSFFKSIRILLQFKPTVVIGVGGYASGPVVLMARVLNLLGLLSVHTAILEQNSVPGFTNRLLGKIVHRVLAAFPGTEKRFPGKEVVVTGNPIRSIMKPLAPAQRDPFTIFIFGGSQGALGVNSLVLDALPHLKDVSSRIRWIHQTGEKDYERVLKGYQAAGISARVEKFIFDMAAAYAEASLLICRAGSSTLAEIAAVKRSAILIPLPTAADNHQEENAKVFSQSGAAILMSQTQSKGEDLARQIRDLMQNPSVLESMEQKVAAFYRPHAAQEVVQTFELL
jgi:UDP-N-acetylglucosamine--N-acetylmuramyl-(pentapeptide) pyrophosphoryl-undecaprenol N-acetylglucosamine transferase